MKFDIEIEGCPINPKKYLAFRVYRGRAYYFYDSDKREDVIKEIERWNGVDNIYISEVIQDGKER